MNRLAFLILTMTLSGCQTFSADQVTTGPNRILSTEAQQNLSGPDILESIYFDLGKASVPQTEMFKLRGIIDWARVHTGVQIMLKGYTDSLGSKGYNLAIAEQRTQNVAQLLRQLGMDAKLIRQFPVGDEGLDSECVLEACRKLQRRVDILTMPPP